MSQGLARALEVSGGKKCTSPFGVSGLGLVPKHGGHPTHGGSGGATLDAGCGTAGSGSRSWVDFALAAEGNWDYKNFLFNALVPKDRFGDMRLSYSKRYSGLGQSVLDTRQEARRDEKAHLWAGEMLKAFFGIGSGSLEVNRATGKQRDDFLADYVGLKTIPFTELPQFSDKSIDIL